MKIRLISKCNASGRSLRVHDYDLIDVLRAISVYDCDAVARRDWRVSDLELWTYEQGAYGSEAITLMFPEIVSPPGNEWTIVAGSRLLERSGLVHQVESGLFMRLVERNTAVSITPGYRLLDGPDFVQATNVDLEIRCTEALPFEVVSADTQMIECLRATFAIAEIS